MQEESADRSQGGVACALRRKQHDAQGPGTPSYHADVPDWGGPTASEGARVMRFDWQTALVSLTLPKDDMHPDEVRDGQWDTCSTSRPRAATSVAIGRSAMLARNFFITRSRCSCDMS